MTQSLGVGAQFGGKYFCHDVRVIRLRDTASLRRAWRVVRADRQALAKITREACSWRAETKPAKYLPRSTNRPRRRGGDIDLRPEQEILATLSRPRSDAC